MNLYPLFYRKYSFRIEHHYLYPVSFIETLTNFPKMFSTQKLQIKNESKLRMKSKRRIDFKNPYLDKPDGHPGQAVGKGWHLPNEKAQKRNHSAPSTLNGSHINREINESREGHNMESAPDES